VVTSTWRKEVHVPMVLRAAGCVARFANPWRTEDVAEMGELSRPREIDAWLAEHGPASEYVILDDDGFAWTELQRGRWVACDSYNGMSLANFFHVLRLFDVAWPQAV